MPPDVMDSPATPGTEPGDGDGAAANIIVSVARRIASPELIGREAELETIARGLAEARAGHGRAVLIGGEAGIGKSRVLAEALERARSEAAVILSGGCIGLAEGALPFAPIVEAIRPLLRDGLPAVRQPELAAAATGGRATLEARGGEPRDEAEGPLAQVALELGLPGLPGAAARARAAASAELRPEWARSHMYEAFLELLRRLASDRAVVLAIEDLHWSDESTRELLAFLIRNARSERLLTLVTFRSDELHRRHPLLPWLIEMGRSPTVERIELSRLGREAVARQIAAILGRRADISLIESIYVRSEGNPLFAEELLAAGADADGVPPTLREVLAARLSRVSEPTSRVLAVAAVVGRRVEHDLLATIAELPDARLDEAIQEAVAAQLLVVDEDSYVERYAFRHALVAEAAAETVLPNRRRRLHAAIAEALESGGRFEDGDEAGRLAEIAHHWFEARELEPAFAASVKAGNAARESGAYAEALRQYDRALELWDVVPDPVARSGIDRVELLRRTAQSAQLTGEFPRAAQLLREGIALAEERSDSVRAGLLSERLGRSLWTAGAIDQSRVAYLRAIELVPESPASRDRARVLGGYAQVLMLSGRHTDSTAIAEEALALAREMGDRQLEGDVLATLGVDLGYVGDESVAIDLLRQAVAIAEEGHDLDAVGRAYANLSSVLEDAGHAQESIEVAMAGGRRMRELGMGVTYAPFVELNAVGQLVGLGRADEALRLVLELEPIARGTGLVFANSLLAWIWTMRGETELATKSIRVAREALGGGEAQFTGPLAETQIELARLTGEYEAGRRVADYALPILAQTEDRPIHARVLTAALRLEADAGERARAARDPAASAAAIDRAKRYLETVDELARVAAPPSRRAALDQARAFAEGEMARLSGSPGVTAWRRGLELARLRGSMADAAYASFRLAEALLEERVVREEASDLLTEAHALAARLAARPLREAIEGLAARRRVALHALDDAEGAASAGDTNRAAADTNRAAAQSSGPLAGYGITAREIEVLRLLASGRTNRQIADELFISESTAGVHVSHILGKLGVAGRVEAATIAARLGLLEVVQHE